MSECRKFFAKEVPNFPLPINWSERFCSLTERFEEFLKESTDLKIRDDDVWIVTMPKCGTTWMQEMAWLIMNDLDFETAKAKDLFDRTPFLEIKAVSPIRHDNLPPLDDFPSPRLIKTHLPMPLLPKGIWTTKAKIIYVGRNPKDTVISYYHFTKGIGHVSKDLELAEFVENFVNDKMAFAPYWDHVLDFWQLRNDPKVFFTSYERMKLETRTVLEDLSQFLGKSIPKEKMESLIDHLSFDKMKDNPAVNHKKFVDKINNQNTQSGESTEFRFMRRGIVGSYKDELAEDLIEMIDKRSEVEWKKHGTNEEEIFHPKLL